MLLKNKDISTMNVICEKILILKNNISKTGLGVYLHEYDQKEAYFITKIDAKLQTKIW